MSAATAAAPSCGSASEALERSVHLVVIEGPEGLQVETLHAGRFHGVELCSDFVIRAVGCVAVGEVLHDFVWC